MVEYLVSGRLPGLYVLALAGTDRLAAEIAARMKADGLQTEIKQTAAGRHYACPVCGGGGCPACDGLGLVRREMALDWEVEAVDAAKERGKRYEN